MTRWFSCLALMLTACHGGCAGQDRQASSSSSSSSPGDSAAPLDAEAKGPPAPIGGERPLGYLKVPRSYTADKPSPLVLVLHGYGSTGADHARMFDLGDLIERERILIAAPDGTENSTKARFWNAVPTCCDFEDQRPDDVGYLRGLVTELRANYAVDPARIYVVGHSNGGAMALRLACDAADLFAAAIDLAGPFYAEGRTECRPSEPVSVRVMHGTADRVVPFEGGPLNARLHPRRGAMLTIPASEKASLFAKLAGCKAPVEQPSVDFDGRIPGAETRVTRYEECQQQTQVELWSLEGVGHAPSQASSWHTAWEFLAAHPKPPKG